MISRYRKNKPPERTGTGTHPVSILARSVDMSSGWGLRNEFCMIRMDAFSESDIRIIPYETRRYRIQPTEKSYCIAHYPLAT
uniref:Uncharacterized protein n=1 Tax=Candidatus Kentrum sp. LFY TaxID=2126342 RepID=A0A450WQ51_9GAMM|nr:MAG: hypothetical protein BECKLFY1418C_GA0070996_105414 [Candidatus Kentron sp. LFY]